MSKKNPKTNTYYWRAVHRLAKEHGISVPRARKLDWESEVDAERGRRSEARILSLQAKRKGSVSRTSKVLPVVSKSKHPKRKTKSFIPASTRKVPTRTPKHKLEFRDYDRIEISEEDEFDEAEDYRETWEADFEGEWEELNDLDDLDGFMEDFEHEDSDKYKEPA